MWNKFEKETKDQIIALSVAFFITALFAAPYFYIQYFDVPKKTVYESRDSGSVLGTIIDPVKGFVDNIKNILNEDVYVKN